VQKGDIFSKILGRMIPGPVWGKNGSFKKILPKNPHILDPNKIAPEQIITLDTPELLETPAEPKIERPAPPAAEIPNAPLSPAVESFHFRGALQASFSYLTSAINVTDSETQATAKITSQSHVRFDLGYHFDVTERVQLFAKTSLSKITFNQPTDSAVTISNSTQNLNGFGLGMNYQVTPELNVGIAVSDEERVFIRAISSTNVTPDTVSLFALGIRANYDFFRWKQLVFGSDFAFNRLYSGSTDVLSITPGSQFRGKIEVKRNVGETMRFNSGIGYFHSSQDTSATLQSWNGWIFSIGMEFLLHGSKPNDRGES
jgi:hypothetical protein